jgi:hypothetical protein
VTDLFGDRIECAAVLLVLVGQRLHHTAHIVSLFVDLLLQLAPLLVSRLDLTA